MRDTTDELITVVIADPDDDRVGQFRTAAAAHPDLAVVADAETPFDAVEQVLEFMPDVVVVEASMEDDDRGTCQAIAHLAPATRIVLVAADTDPRTYAAVLAGASACVDPAEGPAAVAETVRGLTRGETTIGPETAARLLVDLEAAAAGVDRFAPPPSLTATERDVLGRMAVGWTAEQIAGDYDVTERLVNVHVGYAVAKLQLWCRDRNAVAAAAR